MPNSRKVAVSRLPDRLRVKTPHPSPQKTTGAKSSLLPWVRAAAVLCTVSLQGFIMQDLCTETGRNPARDGEEYFAGSILTFRWLLKEGPMREWCVRRPLPLPCCTRRCWHLILVLPLGWAMVPLFQVAFRDVWACISAPALQTLHRCEPAPQQSLCLCRRFLPVLAVSKSWVGTHFTPAISQEKHWQCWLLYQDALESTTVSD